MWLTVLFTMKQWTYENHIWIEEWKFTCKEGQRRYMIFLYSFIHLDHLTGYNKPSKWSAASWLVSSIGRVLRWYRGGSCTFRKRSLLFFELLLSVSIKKKENHDPGSNPDLSYPNLSPLPLHYHIDPLKFPKTLSTYTSKLFFLCYINNRWPYPFP